MFLNRIQDESDINSIIKDIRRVLLCVRVCACVQDMCSHIGHKASEFTVWGDYYYYFFITGNVQFPRVALCSRSIAI